MQKGILVARFLVIFHPMGLIGFSLFSCLLFSGCVQTAPKFTRVRPVFEKRKSEEAKSEKSAESEKSGESKDRNRPRQSESDSAAFTLTCNPDLPTALHWMNLALEKTGKSSAQDRMRLLIAEGCDTRNSPVFEAGSGHLTTFWAQFLIGADLAVNFLSKIAQQQPLRVPRVGIIDQGISLREVPRQRANLYSSEFRQILLSSVFSRPVEEDHGSAVAHLIFGSFPYGVSFNAAEGLFLNFPTTGNFLEPLQGMLDGDRVNGLDYRKSDFINLSFGIFSGLDWSIRSKVRESLIQGPGDAIPIHVFAAGNSGLTGPLNQLIDFFHRDAIFVGSVNPLGVPSYFTHEIEKITIFAPADILLQTFTGVIPSPKLFGGTSGAAPLVTASLANVKCLLSDLTVAQAALLLQQSGVKLTPFLGGHKKTDGAMVNAYQLVRVAHRLMKSDWHLKSVKERGQMLLDRTFFDFVDEAKEELKEGIADLKLAKSYTLQSEKQLMSTDQREIYQKIASGLRRMRKSFLLHPTSETAFYLRDIYAELGFSLNAAFFKGFVSSKDFEAVASCSLTNGFQFKSYTVGSLQLSILNIAGQVFGPRRATFLLRTVLQYFIEKKEDLSYLLDPIVKLGSVPLFEEFMVGVNQQKTPQEQLWRVFLGMIRLGDQGIVTLFEILSRESLDFADMILTNISQTDPALIRLLELANTRSNDATRHIKKVICKKLQWKKNCALCQGFSEHSLVLTNGFDLTFDGEEKQLGPISLDFSFARASE
jgi:hypothetical protein